jgi:hypothetical protein
MPGSARRCLDRSCPSDAEPKRYATRVAGVGSLGRPRFVTIAEWRRGQIIREAKALVPSAWCWAHDRKSARSRLLEAARSGHRSPDPHLDVDRRLVVRRLAADAIKIEFEELPRKALQKDLFDAMGFDLGSFHGSRRKDAKAIINDLSQRRGVWLHDAADKAEAAVKADFREWTEK